MKLKFKKLVDHAVAPAFGSDHAAGLDLCASADVTVAPGQASLIPTGVAVEIPAGHMGLLALRSSTPIKTGLFIPNGVGIIDADYRGELKVMVAPMGREPVQIKAGDRIAQLVIVPARVVATAEGHVLIEGVAEVDALSESVRGAGGFGSTGV